MAQVLAEPQLEFLHPVARAIGGPQVRNMGTVGGNLFAAHPYGDFAVALLALGARSRWPAAAARPVEDILRDRTRPAGLVAAIEVPRPRPGSFGFSKVSRVKPKGVSVLSIAVLAPREGGQCAACAWPLARWVRGRCAPQRSNGRSRASGSKTRRARAAKSAAADGLHPPTDALASAGTAAR
jgi:CO/xanthine dehydrogenase FAD-binding subunit